MVTFGKDDFSPVFSPDNKTVIFGRAEYYVNNSSIAQRHPLAWNFYASDLDGKNVRQVTYQSFYHVSPTSVSPDGKSIVVVVEDLNGESYIAIYPIDKTGPPLRFLRPHVPKEDDHKNPILNFPNFIKASSLSPQAREGTIVTVTFIGSIQRLGTWKC